MGTWAAIFIKTNDLESVTNKLQKLSNIDTVIRDVFPTKDLYENMLLDDDTKPTYLVFAQTQPSWIMIRHNGFKNLEKWGEDLSEFFKTKIIIACAQTNAGFYHFSLYDKGEMQRKIECCYGSDYEPINIGNRFEFEDEQPGSKEEYDGETEYIFDFDNIEEYSRHFGLEIQPNYDDKKEWLILKSSVNQNTLKNFYNKPKAWWKFW